MEGFVIAQGINVSINLLATTSFFILLVIYALFSTILVYHWREYSTNTLATKRTLQLYFLSTAMAWLLAGSLLFFI